MEQPRLRPRPAHPAGPTVLTYTPNGKHLVTAGVNNVVRVFATGSDDEPNNLDDTAENVLALAATNDVCVLGSEDGTVSVYGLASSQYEKMLTRCTLPIRDLAISPDGKWIAVASDELPVKLVDMNDMLNVHYLRAFPKPPKHVSWHPSSSHLTVSCTDGVVYLYQMQGGDAPLLERRIDDVIRVVETDSPVSTRAAWHPDGRAFAVPTISREVQVVSSGDGEKQKRFSSGHSGDLTALAWSPNGALMLTAGTDGKIVLWDSRNMKVLARYEYGNVLAISWHTHQNLASFATTEGEVYMFPSIVPTQFASLLDEDLQTAPFLHEPLSETSGNARKQMVNGEKPNGAISSRLPRARSPDSLDELLPSDLGGYQEEGDDFVVDDDGAGYTGGINGNGKRTNDYDVGGISKRHISYSDRRPILHQPFQPGSTEWRGNRRYLCLNLTGSVWTVDQETHNTVTVEFYDRELHRDFHFTDPFKYDKACLNETGSLFSCPGDVEHPAMLYYRPHETWTARHDWRIRLSPDEVIAAIALSESFITVLTTNGYVRIYTLFGLPFRVYRQKSCPPVTCAAWRDYSLLVGNGQVDARGDATLRYTIQSVRSGEIYQSEDVVALPFSGTLRSVFFSDEGDPCIYDSAGFLLVLQHWRRPGQAQWVPLLDTSQLERLASGRKDETYWPVAVANGKFHCIILKGGDTQPYFPRPLLSDFDFHIPIAGRTRRSNLDTGDDEEGEASNALQIETEMHEENFVRTSLLQSLAEDEIEHVKRDRRVRERHAAARLAVEADKALLQLLSVECRQGEARGMKALELAQLLRDNNGKMLEAAGKIAARFEMDVLETKIREVAERRMLESQGD